MSINHRNHMNRMSPRLCLLVAACLMGGAYARAQDPPDPWLNRHTKPKDIDEPKVFPDTFSIELPKGWQLAPGFASTVFSAVEKTRLSQDGGLIVLQYQRLQAPLEPDMMTAAAQREMENLQLREASGKGFTSEVKTGPNGPVLVVHYDRPGLIPGRDEHVVQYAVPAGTTFYRLICIAPAGDSAAPDHKGHAEKYRPLFAYVAASFKPIIAGQ
jgi:hypothetical protein